MNKLVLTFSLLILLVNKSFEQEVKKTPFVLGEIDTIKSEELNETRILNIYFPEGYSTDSSTKYPVIYLLDGSADEDFIHIAGLMQFANFSWVNMLPKSILVGISNVDRRRDFTFPTTIEKDKKDYPTTGGSAKFIDFIAKELQPYIETHYKTSTTKTIIGQSLGGLLATEILYNYTSLFTHYIIVSPSLWWNAESLLSISPVMPPDSNQSTRVYIAVGKEEKIMVSDTRKLVDLLKKNSNLKVTFRYFSDEDHATILHLAVYRAFQSFNLKK